MTEQEFKTLGRYTILGELGRGGFATVYRALDPQLEREIALKVMHPMLLSDPTFTQRFRREAKALAALRHANIIVVHEVSQAEGRMYIAMELANGSSLDKFIAERGPLPLDVVTKLIRPVCEALDYAHGQGIVHRDLKPANILVDKDRGPLLTDFGMARLMGGSSASMSLSGGILGTPAYIAPEVWEAEEARPAADIYSLGCIVFEMLAGKVLFTGESPMHIMRAHDKGPRFPDVWPDGTPAGIEAVLGRALDHRPEERYHSAGEFYQALNDLEIDARQATERSQVEALAAPWRQEAQNALAAREWSVARKAIGRWLAISPADELALAMRDEVDRLQARELEDRGAQVAAARDEAEKAFAAGNWAGARIGVSRWLAVSPNDAAAQRLRTEIERRAEAERRQAQEMEQAQANVAAYRRQTEEAIAVRNWTAARSALAQWQAMAPNDPNAAAAQARIDRQKQPGGVRMWAFGVGLVVLLCIGLGSAALLRGINNFIPVTNATPTEGEPVLPGIATETRAPTRTPANTRTPTRRVITSTRAATITETPTVWVTDTPRLPGDPLVFMRDYYDLVSSHDCSTAFSKQTDRFKISLGTIDKFHEYEAWCKTIQEIEFTESEVQSVSDSNAELVLRIRYTYTNGHTAVDRPILFGLVVDHDTREWRINSGRYTE